MPGQCGRRSTAPSPSPTSSRSATRRSRPFRKGHGPRPDDRDPFERLQAAGGVRAGPPPRPSDPHPGRADRRTRPEPEERGPAAHQEDGRRKGRHPFDPHTRGGRGDLHPDHHHLPGQDHGRRFARPAPRAAARGPHGRDLPKPDRHGRMKQITPIFKREFLGYFRTPVAYVFLVAFLLISVGLAFSRFGGFLKAGIASLDAYFGFYPWIFLFIVPAAGMRLWSEEKKTGTAELLFTLPVTTLEAVIGKFLAGWAFLALAIALSFPMTITIGYLGSPDWGVVATSYLGAILMAGGFLSVCSLTSAFTKNQVISFVISLAICTVLVFLGYSGFTAFLEGFLPVGVADAISNFSFVTHFNPMVRGIVDPKDVVFFLSLMGFTLFLNVWRSSADPQRPAMRFGSKTLAIALLVVGLVLVNYLATSIPARYDATSEKIYTLSPGTKALLAKITEPTTLDLYFSRNASGQFVEYKNYAERVREMLRQYVRASNGKVRLNVIDPEPDTPDEEKATAVGIQPQTIPGGSQFYFGLVATQADQQKVIGALNPQREQFLEYDVSELIYGVGQTDKKKLGLITSLPLQGSPGMPMMG